MHDMKQMIRNTRNTLLGSRTPVHAPQYDQTPLNENRLKPDMQPTKKTLISLGSQNFQSTPVQSAQYDQRTMNETRLLIHNCQRDYARLYGPAGMVISPKS